MKSFLNGDNVSRRIFEGNAGVFLRSVWKFPERVSGFSLVEVMIASGLMGGLSVILFNLSSEQIRQEQGVSFVGMTSTYQVRASELLRSSLACINTLGVRTHLVPSTATSLSVIKNNKDNDTIFQVGRNLGKDDFFRLEALSYEFDPPNTAISIVGTTSEYWSEARLKMTLKLNPGAMPGYTGVIRQKTLTVPLRVRSIDTSTTPGTNRFELLYCHNSRGYIMGRPEVCHLFGGSYHGPSNRCHFAKYNSGNVCTSMGICLSPWTDSTMTPGTPTNPIAPESQMTGVSATAAREYMKQQFYRIIRNTPMECSSNKEGYVRRVPGLTGSNSLMEYCDGSQWQPVFRTPASSSQHHCMPAFVAISDLRNPPQDIYSGTGSASDHCPSGYSLSLQLGYFYYGRSYESLSPGGAAQTFSSAIGILADRSNTAGLSTTSHKMDYPALITFRRSNSLVPTSGTVVNQAVGTDANTHGYGHVAPLLCCK